jgi:hypothetical protein
MTVAGVDVTVTLATGGMATTDDYPLSTTTITIAAGETSGTAPVTAVQDSCIRRHLRYHSCIYPPLLQQHFVCSLLNDTPIL